MKTMQGLTLVLLMMTYTLLPGVVRAEQVSASAAEAAATAEQAEQTAEQAAQAVEQAGEELKDAADTIRDATEVEVEVDVTDLADEATAEPADDPMAQMAAAMAEWARTSTPNEHHARLLENVGTWDVAASFWMTPDAPAQESNAVSTISPILGGRYIQEIYQGTVQMPGMEPQPFEGLGLFGYDVAKQQYVGIWTDTMSTSPMVTAGQFDESTQTLTLSCEFDCPLQGPSTMTMTQTRIGPDEFVVTGYQTPKGGEQVKVMELVYKRRY